MELDYYTNELLENPLIECACGCGKIITKYNEYNGKERRYFSAEHFNNHKEIKKAYNFKEILELHENGYTIKELAKHFNCSVTIIRLRFKQNNTKIRRIRKTIKTGTRFGRLTVTNEYQPGKHGNNKYKCICDCGNITWVKVYNLTDNITQSCGCLHKELCWLSDGLAAKKNVYRRYISEAKRRNIEFNLTFDEFINLTQQDCYYCGIVPTNISKSGSNSKDYIYNGVDRVDNDKGYFIDNCVPCCSLCNQMKMNMTLEKFYDKIDKIYERRIKNK